MVEWLNSEIGPYDYDTCEVCERPLPKQTRGRPRVTCSDRCRQIKRRRDYKSWREPQEWEKDKRRARRELKRMEREAGPIDDTPIPDWPTLTLRKRILLRLERGIEPQWCKQCYKPYIIDAKGASRTYCSRKCQRAANENRKAVMRGVNENENEHVDPRVFVRLRLQLPIRACKHCGKPFPRYYNFQKFCSNSCRNAYWYKTHKTCPRCGKRFSTEGRNAGIQYCSKRCKDSAVATIRKGYPPTGMDRSLRRCKECGVEFNPNTVSQKYCGKDCREQASVRMARQRRQGLL